MRCSFKLTSQDYCALPIDLESDYMTLDDGTHLCEKHVEETLLIPIPMREGGYIRKATMKSKFCGSLSVINAEKIRQR